MSFIDNTKHIKKFGGELWYVRSSAVSGDGKAPDRAFQTIGEAITACSAGDGINIMAGTYTEVGLDVNKDAVELWAEIGTIIQPASGIGLTVSGDACRIEGRIIIYPTEATGILISGRGGLFKDIVVSGGTKGFEITGELNEIIHCKCNKQTTYAFYIGADLQELVNCSTVGDNGATYGYHINNGSDTGLLINCTSIGHGTAGFYIGSGSKDWTLNNCSSGQGDGKWRDVDNNSVWSNFSYDAIVFKEVFLTLTGGAGSGLLYNLFKVTGAVKIHNLYGHVETQCAATPSTINLVLGSAGGSVNITDTGSAPNLNAAPVGTLYERNSIAAEPLDSANPSAQPRIIENVSTKTPERPLTLVADTGDLTYIQLKLSAALASGTLHFHCHWEAITDNGFLEAV